MSEKEKVCPKCGKKMVVRKNKKNGNDFYGCTGYPECTYCEPLNQEFVTCPKCGKQAKVIHYKDKFNGKPKTAHICDECGYKDWNVKE